MARFGLLVCVILVFGTAVTGPVRAAEIALDQDGWYRWEVPAGPGGLRACCHEIRGGTVRPVACTLGVGMNEFSPEDACEMHSNAMQVFVEVRNGRVREIRPLSSACTVHSDTEVRTIEDVTTAESIAWLKRQVDQHAGLADEAIMTLSFHADDQGLATLFEILEDTGQRQDAREQALFWLVQSGSDEAFAYLDQLLD